MNSAISSQFLIRAAIIKALLGVFFKRADDKAKTEADVEKGRDAAILETTEKSNAAIDQADQARDAVVTNDTSASDDKLRADIAADPDNRDSGSTADNQQPAVSTTPKPRASRAKPKATGSVSTS